MGSAAGRLGPRESWWPLTDISLVFSLEPGVQDSLGTSSTIIGVEHAVHFRCHLVMHNCSVVIAYDVDAKLLRG